MRNSQSGNILFLILIAVALFAALSYAITGSSRSGSDTITKDKAKIAAAEIIQYGTQLEQAVSRLQLINGCKENQISFERAPFDGSDTDYDNPNAPTDFRCHVFHPSGGGVAVYEVDQEWLDTTRAAETYYGTYYIYARGCVPYVGTGTKTCYSNAITTDEDLLFFIPYLKEEICWALAERLVLSGDGKIPRDGGNLYDDGHFFKGSFAAGRLLLNDADGSETLNGHYNGCISTSTYPILGSYVYYHVLMAR